MTSEGGHIKTINGVLIERNDIRSHTVKNPGQYHVEIWSSISQNSTWSSKAKIYFNLTLQVRNDLCENDLERMKLSM